MRNLFMLSVGALAAVLSAWITLAAPAQTATQPGGAATQATQPETRPAIGQVITTESGLIYHFTQHGTGPKPQDGDTLVVKSIGRFTDGREFWSTHTDNRHWEYRFNVDRIIAGSREVMQGLRVGDRVVVTMKPELAYGNRARPDIPANSTLVFDYEILSIKPAATRPATQPATRPATQPASTTQSR